MSQVPALLVLAAGDGINNDGNFSFAGLAGRHRRQW